MEMALGRQRVLVLRVVNQPVRPVYDAATSERLYRRRELRQQLEREKVANQQRAANTMAWWNGLY